MAIRPRVQMLRWHGQAMNDLDRCLGKLQLMQAKYAPKHPEQHKMVSMIARATIELQTLLAQFEKDYM